MPLLSGKKAPLFFAGALVACGAPELNSELNTEGPPEVTEVNVSLDNGAEVAMFCTPDLDLNVHTGYCGADRSVDPVMDGEPVGAEVRIVFDELLDPNVETLYDPGPNDDPIATLDDTDPVTVTCNGTEVAYDGFYAPSGNHITSRPGPALVVVIEEFAGTAVDCDITLKDVITDKDGNAVPSDQRGPDLYTFTVAPLKVAATQPPPYVEDPDGDPMTPPPDVPTFDPAMEGNDLLVQFNAPVDPASVTDQITLTDADGNVVSATLTASGSAVKVIPDTALVAGTEYVMTLVAEGSTIVDSVAGNPLALGDDVVVKFIVPEPPMVDAGQ